MANSLEVGRQDPRHTHAVSGRSGHALDRRGDIGIAFGFGASLLISRLAGWTTVVGPGAVLLAVLLSALVGIGFGYCPARTVA
jgi:hypothetical protein